MPRHQALALALAFALSPIATFAATPDKSSDLPTKVDARSEWLVHGGNVLLRFNVDRLSGQGITLAPGAHNKDANPDFADYIEFPIYYGDGLRLAAANGNFQRFTGGKVVVDGGFKLHTTAGKTFDYSRFELRADPENAMRLLLVGADGKAWFYINHVMYKFVDDHSGFFIRSADVNATAAFAERVGAANLTDAYVGEIKMLTSVIKHPDTFHGVKAVAGGPNFHGTNGYQADVLLTSYTMSFMRCRTSTGTNGCNGVGGDDGEVVFAPSSTLRNSNKANTADVSWYQKFSSSPYSYPYPGNDQHPYLIWGLYRVNDGQLEQIAASGVKHAFLTTNIGCASPYGNHILSPDCSDTYGTGNNDAVGDLGPRNELIPATGRWGRCFSIFDTNCDGVANNVGTSQYQNRMSVRESQLELAGSTFYTDSWYVVQDDIDIYNTMGHRLTTLTPGANSWSVASQGTFTPGPVINTWVDPTANPTQNVALDTPEGHARVAVKVKTLANCPAGSGLSGTCYRYDYAVHNFDIARAVLNTSAPANAQNNLQVISNKGFVSVSLPHGVERTLYLDTGNFADIDINAGNSWTAVLGASDVSWTAPAGNELNWGQLYRFSVVTDVAPNSADTRPIALGIQGGTGPSSYQVNIMVPNTFDLFSDGMEN